MPKDPKAFVQCWPSQDLKESKENVSNVSQSEESVRTSERGDILQEYLEASTRFHQTGIVDFSMIDLCSEPVVSFLNKSKDITNFYDANIPKLENILWALNSGGHENLAGILLWASLLVKPLILTELHYIPYWRIKVLGLIRDFVEESPRIVNSLSEFSKFTRTQESECLAIVEDLSRNGEDLMSEVLTRMDVKLKSQKFSKNTKDDVRISLTPSDYVLILLQPSERCKKIYFEESCAPVQFKIIKLAADTIFIEHLQEIKRLMYLMNKDKNSHPIKSVKETLNNKKWKGLHTLEKNIVVHALSQIQTSLATQRKLLHEIREVLNEFASMVGYIKHVTRVKFEGNNERLEFFENLDEPGLETFRTVIENLNFFHIVNYAPSDRVGKWIENLILEFGTTNQPPGLPYEVIPYNIKNRSSPCTTFYNYGREINSPCDHAFKVPEPEQNPDDDEWLRPMVMIQEYRPSETEVSIPNQPVSADQPKLVAVPEKPCQYLKRMAIEFSRALNDPTLSVLQILINPIPPRLPEPIGFLESVCFLISLIYTELNLKRFSNEHEEIRKQCFALVRTCDKMDITRLVNNNFVKRRISGLLDQMEFENHRRLEKVHLLSTHEMIGYLSARCGIMNKEEARAHAIAKIKNQIRNPEGEFEIFYKAEEIDLKIYTGQFFLFAELAPCEQLSLLVELIRIVESTLAQANEILENSRSRLDEALTYLIAIENYTRPAANPVDDKFRPEEIFILIRTLKEQLKIWNQYFLIFESVLDCSKANIQKLLKDQKQQQGQSIGPFPICPFVDNPFILQLNSTWTPSQASNTPNEFAMLMEQRFQQNTRVSTTSVSSTLKNLVANIIHPRRAPTSIFNLEQFPQFISTFRKDVDSLASFNISNFNKIRTVFLGISSPEFSGLSGLEILIGHAFLEIRNFSALSDEYVENIRSSLKELMSEANLFKNSAIPLLHKYSKRNTETIQKITAIAPVALPSGDSEELDSQKEFKLPQKEEISKSELNLLLDGKTKSLSRVEENWIMILGEGSKIRLRRKLRPDKIFEELSREIQGLVTIQLIDLTRQVFDQTTKNVQQKLRRDVKKFDQSVISLLYQLMNFTRNNRLSTEQQLQIHQSLETLTRSAQIVTAVIESIEKESNAICQRLGYLKLYKDLCLIVNPPPSSSLKIPPGVMRHQTQTHQNLKAAQSRKRQLEEYIKNLHTFSIFVRLPTINL